MLQDMCRCTLRRQRRRTCAMLALDRNLCVIYTHNVVLMIIFCLVNRLAMSQVDPENLAVGVPKVAGSTCDIANTSGISARLKNQILNTIVSIALNFVKFTYLIASVENSVTHMPPWFALNCPKDLSDGSRMMHPVFPSSESPQFSMETVPVISVDCTTLHSPPPPVRIDISLRC